MKFRKDLRSIIEYVNKIQEINTENVIPTSQVTGLENIFREDIVKPSFSQKEALANATRKYKGYFVAKSVFE